MMLWLRVGTMRRQPDAQHEIAGLGFEGRKMIHWKRIAEYDEPDWEKNGTDLPPLLFWRPTKGATLGYVRDGELFDAKWVYVCDSNKISHFSAINTPSDNVVDLDAHRSEAKS